MDDYVWIIDNMTGAGYPVAKAIADSDKDRYRQDPKHPVFDRNGNLLPAKSPAEKEQADKAANK